jgi:hypothetical protein
VRIEVIILYFFAVFHKLNGGFFTAATSCATDLLVAQQMGEVIPMTASVFTINAYATLAIEFSIPLLLCIRKTRNAGVLIGLFFHCVVSYSTYNACYDFSSMVFAVYFLFISPDFSVSVKKTLFALTSYKRSFFRAFFIRRFLSIAAITSLAILLIYVLNQRMDSFQSVHLYFFWTIYSIIFAALFVRFILASNNQEPPALNFRLMHASLLVMPLVVFVNGTLPYLGLKTENSYAMFSNLRTEGGKTNHLIIPASAQLFDFQKDVVQVISSSDPGLQDLARENRAMVLFEFRNYVNDRKPEYVEYLLNGKTQIFQKSDIASYRTLGENPFVLKKLMRFRPFNIEEPQPCAH